MLNSVLLSSAQRIINNSSPAQFTISAHFINSESASEFSFYPLSIDQILIDADYLENYGDVIDLFMTISPHDYALLQDQGQNLLCVLTYTYVTKDGRMLFDPAPVRKQYHVTINDSRDIRKMIPDVQSYTEPSMPVQVRLVEDSIYRLRHTRINTVFQNSNLTQVIYSLTQKFGITKIELVPLDNTHQYDHVDISSYQGIDSIYQFLQHRFGLYEKGATSYITNDVLYIYPPFETEPVYDKTAIFYQVDEGRFAGAHIFHRVENNNVSIVINNPPESYDLSISGSENVGTGFVFTRASRMTDGLTSPTTNNGAEYTERPSLTVRLDSDRMAVKGVNNIRHVRTTDNPYPMMSEIISHQASIMQVNWMHADPFQIDPGHAVTYYYDFNERMVKKTGIVQHAVFSITKMEKTGAKDMFGVVATLTLRLSPNTSVVV